MKCPVCGSQNPDNSDTCSVCGYDLTPYPSVLGGIPEGFLEKERRRVAAAKRVWEKSQARVAAAEAKQAELEAQLRQLKAQPSRTLQGGTTHELIKS
ncbi:MAG: zinc-ribbon domain, partial [Phormidium sp. OSCR]